MIINLDHNATTPIHPEVAEAMAQCYLSGYGNAASSHQFGRRARQILEEAREGLGRILGADTTGMHADRIILTSGGTESNNLALLGLCGGEPGRVIISSVEHPSVVGPAEQLQRRGFDVQRLRVDTSGVVDESHLDELLTPNTRLVSIMLSQQRNGGVTADRATCGAVPPGGCSNSHGCRPGGRQNPGFFRPTPSAGTDADTHKFHGPRGIGALIVKRDLRIDPLLFGGTQQMGVRPGSEPIELAVGLYRALQIWQRDAQTRRADDSLTGPV